MPEGASGTASGSYRSLHATLRILVGATVATRRYVQSFVLRHPVKAYFALAFTFSWLLWLPRVASEQGWWERSVPEWWHYAGAAGPIGAALLVSKLQGAGHLTVLSTNTAPLGCGDNGWGSRC